MQYQRRYDTYGRWHCVMVLLAWGPHASASWHLPGIAAPRRAASPPQARQRCDARRARVLESVRSATTAAGGREGELGRAIGRARTTLGAENRSAIVATAQRQRFSRLADSRAQATWRSKATYDLPVFFRMDAQGGGCTPDSCVRGCTLTIVAYRRIDESRAIRITKSRGIPSILMRLAYRPIEKGTIKEMTKGIAAAVAAV